MGDRVIINELERGSSADINDLQALATRQVSEVLRYLGAFRQYPAASTGPGSDTTQSPGTWCSGLTVEAAGASNYVVNAGFLCSATPSNLTIGTLDSAQAIGFLRAAVVRTMPVANPTRTAGEYYLISARVIDVSTSRVVDIYDIPTEVYSPQTKPKQAEFQIEIREDVGPSVPSLAAYGALPVLNAYPASAGWTPLAVVKVYPDTGNPAHGQVMDLRRDIRDILRGAPQDPISYTSGQSFPPEILRRDLESVGTPANPSGYTSGFRGKFRATLNGSEYSVAVRMGDHGVVVNGNALETLTAGNLTHVYLVPYKGGPLTRVPSFGQATANDFSLQRGFLVACQSSCPPTRDGKNSGSIRLPQSGATGIYSELADISPGEAVHVFSAQSAATAIDFLPFVMTGNRLMYSINSYGSAGTSGARNAITSQSLVAGTTVLAVTLTGLVPTNARWVELAVKLTMGSGAAGPSQCLVAVAKEDAKIGGGASLTADRVLDTTVIPCGHASTVWWGRLRIPLYTPNDEDTPSSQTAFFSLAAEFTYQVLSGSTFGSATADVYVAGWELGQ